MNRILEPGSNCWRLARARRVGFIVDCEAYFRAVREAILEAQHVIFIVGWDVHGELRLVRDERDDGDDAPETLRALIDAVAHRKPDLDVYVLNWDFAMIYALEREFNPRYKLGWKSHDRVHFHMDAEHPIGGSQHQKLVVVDDRVAFSGGIDLSQQRWDTSAHLVDDERRTDPSGKPYPPFHDVQVAVDGDAAERLGEIARDRWRIASGRSAAQPRPVAGHDPWPPSVDVDLTDVEIGIARTYSPHPERPEAREVEQLHLDGIAAADRFIYIENQYLSSHRVGEALAQRLQSPGGPEVIVVMPEKTGGWLEQHTMDVLRARLLRALREADRFDRLRVYFVRLSEERGVTLMIHAKVTIIDDAFARVGSANLSNRSMGLDSECDLAVESTETRDCRPAIQRFRRRLLAEHLGVSVDELSEAEGSSATLISAIERLRGDDPTLVPLSGDVPEVVDEWVPDAELLDPEKPVAPETLFDAIVSPADRMPDDRQMLHAGVIALAFVALAAAWRWTPLGDWLSLDAATSFGQWLDDRPLTPLLVIGFYITAGLVAMPITLLIVATILVFGPWVGLAYAWSGSILSALATYGIGRTLGRDGVGRLAGTRLNRIRRTLAERGLLTVVTVRVVPVAPFSIVNLVAGVSALRFRDFVLGTAIGMLPGIAAIALLSDRLVSSLREPSASTLVALVVAAIVVIGAVAGLRRLLGRQSASDTEPA